MQTFIARFCSPSSLLALAIALFGLTVPRTSAGDQVPYKGSARGAVISREDINGGVAIPGGLPFRHVVSRAVGNFTHLGKATVILDQEVRLIIDGGVPYLIIEGTYVATAANGDTIFGPFTNKQNAITGEFTTETEVTGGTGRFAGENGLTSGAGLFNAADDTFSYYLEGTISTVGSNKK